jgi:hypothetical protein
MMWVRLGVTFARTAIRTQTADCTFSVCCCPASRNKEHHLDYRYYGLKTGEVDGVIIIGGGMEILSG